jgi:polysaccharide export outer membrane protein
MLRRISGGVITAAVLSSVLVMSGCGDQDYINPTAIGRFRPTPVVNVILDSLEVGEEEPSAYSGAEEPRPADLIGYEEDYTIGPGDVVRVAIYELLQQGQTDIRDYVVTEGGKVSIPEAGSVQAGGLTEKQLESEIKQVLSPAILKQPSVTVTLQSSEKKIFTVNGDGVNRPGRYPIPRSGFRLTDALATAGSVGQFNVSYVYVTRQITGRESVPQASPQSSAAAGRTRSAARHIVTAAEMVTEQELRSLAAPEGSAGTAGQKDIAPALSETNAVAKKASPGGRIEWVFKDGRWVPMQTGEKAETLEPVVEPAEKKTAIEEAPVEKPSTEKPSAEKPVTETPVAEKPAGETPPSFGWEQVGGAGAQSRLIKIPVKKLMSGDPKYDIVIKASDKITVPLDIVGEFCIYGNVNSVGFIPLTGRPITLTGAVAAAGGLGPLAWPENVEVRRRIDENHEAIVMVNLKKIAEGTQPDFFIKPHDSINIGTHPSARWLAVLRNAFRATYGMGFIYDRNFADRDVQRPINIF